MRNKIPPGTRLLVCNTGTLRASHLRLEGASKTLCGKRVAWPNKGDSERPACDATCQRCRQFLPPWSPRR